MAEAELNVSVRDVMRKKTRFLRREGWLPANVYGRGEESTPVQLQAHEFDTLLRHGGANTVYNLAVAGQGKPEPVVIRDVQRDPVSRQLLHVDFLRVSMTETMTATVPLVFFGESKAIKDLGGTLVHGLDHIVVSALPGNIPQHIEVDLAHFDELEETIHVADLPPMANVSIVTDGGQMVAKVASPRVQVEGEAEEAVAPAEAEPAGDEESEAVH